MADWKVFKTKIEILPHYNADSLEVGRVDTYQIVTQKGRLKDGEDVIFIPEKSILPENLKKPWENYLKGPNKDRVGSVRLRNEASMGIVMTIEEAKNIIGNTDFEYDVDISDKLGIKKYEPPIPQQLSGQVKSIDGYDYFSHHDVNQLGSFINNFVIGEEIIVSEKLHGSQCSIIYNRKTGLSVTSKGLAKQGLKIERSESNSYWQAIKNVGLEEYLDETYFHNENYQIQIFAELIPCQKGYSYGQDKPTLKIFRIKYYLDDVNTTIDNIDPSQEDNFIKNLWVPIIYKGPLNDWTEIRKLAEGKEQVSGKELHIREGVVVSPVKMRKARNNDTLICKIINSKYKESGEEFN